MKRLKILLFHQYFLEDDDPGGSRWNEMARLWREDGHEITVIAGMVPANGFLKRPGYKGKFHVKSTWNRLTVHRVHVSEMYNRGFYGRMWGYCSYMFSSLWAALFCIKGGFDLVIVTSPPLSAGIAGYLAAVFKRAPVVFEVRDLWPESAIELGMLKNPCLIRLAFRLERFFYRKAFLVSVLTPAFRHVLIREKGVLPEKLLLVPNAADFEPADRSLENFDREAFRDSHGFSGRFVVIYVGAHGIANGLDLLLEAAKRLEGTDVLFVLVGEGTEKKRLMEEAREVRNIRFMDAVPKSQVFRLIAAADLGVSILVKREIFKTVYSNKTFDYMACKIPVLMAIDGVSREMIEKARAGAYADPGDIEGFVRVVGSYRKEPVRLRTEGQNGFDYVRKHFDRRVLAAGFIRELEQRLKIRDLKF